MSTLATLRTLHATIGAALDDIDKVYNNRGLDYPPLDVPFYRSSTPASDSKRAEAQKLTVDPVVTRASNLIVAACGQLTATVQNPFYGLLEGINLGHVTAALSFLEASHTVEILREAGPQGLHANDLARKIEELRLGKDAPSDPTVDHMDPVKLSHVLRLLATNHWLREVQPNVFANNRQSSLINSGKTLEQISAEPDKKYDNTDGAAAFVAMFTDETFRSVVALTEWLLPSKTKKPPTAFNLAHKTDELYYVWLERPENASRLTRTGRAMTGASSLHDIGSITDTSVFAWDKLPQNAVVVDVGGGVGSISVKLAEAYPQLRLLVQDRAQTIAIAPKVWGGAHKDLFDSGRVSYQAQDFFEPQPATLQVPGAGAVAHPAAYVVTRVMHNWPDAECIRILKNLRAAAVPDTKLVLHEIILPLACAGPSEEGDESSENSGALAPAGSPLLPNLGRASLAQYQLDLTMMLMMNSRERTLEEFRELTAAAGWRIIDVTRSNAVVAFGYIVAAPA